MQTHRGAEPLVGRTPLIGLRSFRMGDVRIFAELEGDNPRNSIKARTVRAIVDEADRSGVLKPGGAIVDVSTGNAAIALAFLAH